MTTIAYRDGVIASDSRTTVKSFIDSDNVKKLFKLPDGAVVGMAGGWEAGMILYNELKKSVHASKNAKSVKLPTVRGKYSAILVTPAGDSWFNYQGEWTNLKEFGYDYFAIGSGADVATAAMDANATAKEAVAIGIKRDIYSGGKVQSYKVF